MLSTTRKVYLVCSKRISKEIELSIRITLEACKYVATVPTLPGRARGCSILGTATCGVLGPHSTPHHKYMLNILLQMRVFHEKDGKVCVCSSDKHGGPTCGYCFKHHLLCSWLLKRHISSLSLHTRNRFLQVVEQ